MHMGITISVQACGPERSGHVYILLGGGGERTHTSAHLVEPADEAQAACGRLGGVQTPGLSRVVVVDPRCLGDAVQQLLVRYGGAEGQILAHHLEKRITIQKKKKKGLRA